jgi:hypothetical protein
MELSSDFAIPSMLTTTKWVKAIDLLPGTPALVRSATISVEDGPQVALWEPGGDLVAAPQGTAFKLPADSRLLVHVRYKKSYLDEQQTLTDRSTIGLYFSDGPSPAKEIHSFSLAGPVDEGGSRATRAFRKAFETGGRLVALRPSVDKPCATMTIDAVAPSGQRTALLKLRGIRPEWPRRYWLKNPIDLPPGVAIEVSTTPSDPDSGPLAAPVKGSLDVALDFVAP